VVKGFVDKEVTVCLPRKVTRGVTDVNRKKVGEKHRNKNRLMGEKNLAWGPSMGTRDKEWSKPRFTDGTV